MSKTTRRFTAGMALLLIGLSLTTAVNLTAPRTVRADPGVLYAAPTAQGSGNCSSWANACTLQTALAQAVSGDEIWVKAGVHYPGAAGNRTATFQLKNGVALYGGFAGTETQRDQRDWQANKTILSGDIDQNDNHGGDYINENASQIVGSNAYHVVTGSGRNATAVLDGFVVTAGQAQGTSHWDGGGMYNSSGSPTLRNVIFSGNSAGDDGSGMYNYYNSSPTLTNVTFSGNSAGDDGGGMYNYDNSSPTLTNVTFSGNSASRGGAIYNYSNSSPVLTDVTFSSNTATDSGGGMYNGFDTSPTLTNVIFSGNTATNYHGGGIYHDRGNLMLTDVTFNGNTAGNTGGGLSIWGGVSTLRNVTFNGNLAEFGGGIYNSSGITLTNVTFSSNVADYYGGGISNEYSNPTLTNVIFISNTAGIGGGGMDNSASSPTLMNVIFSKNTADKGGGIYNGYYSSSSLTNVAFGSNTANYGGGIYNYSHNDLTLANVIIWGNTATVGGDSLYNYDTSNTLAISYSDIQGCGGSYNWNSACGTDGGNNIDADPLFVDAAGGNLRLQAGSPAIDAGNDAAVPPGVTTDLDGNPRFNYTVDMGAYEYQHTAPGPRPFGKTLPLNGNTFQPLTVTLAWRASALADHYEYCYDTNDNALCDTTWLTTMGTSVEISGLNPSTLYSWQVRAVNVDGTTEADGGAWWSFTTAPSRPSFFNKSAPPNGTTRTLVAPTLSWSASPGVAQYEYCYDTTDDNACSTWLSAGTNTSVTLPVLLPDTTYYWQVRAVNSYGTTYANGSSANFWRFTTYHLPGAFNKTSPADGSERENTVTLSWGTSTDAAFYEVCYDTTNDNACASWVSTGANTSVTLSDLDPGATYYWQVRARNAGGVTYADGSSTAFWSFRVNLVRWDGNTNKPSPNQVWFWTNLARTQWSRFRLKYAYSGYCQGVLNESTTEFQFDGPGNITGGQFSGSSASFSFTGQINSPTSASGTFVITNYRLVLQGTSGTCTVYVNDFGTWTTTRPLLRPGVFGKAEPANGATNQNTTLALWWDPSTDAAEYQYCLDTTNNDACDTNWISTGTNLGVDLSGLNENTTYYWQVRASNTVGATDADDGVWWSFTTQGVRRIFLPLVLRNR